jgi:hypothetical protein
LRSQHPDLGQHLQQFHKLLFVEAAARVAAVAVEAVEAALQTRPAAVAGGAAAQAEQQPLWGMF